jgi:hypothetical protein
MGMYINTTMDKLKRFLSLDFSGISFIITIFLYALTIFGVQYNPFVLYLILLINFSSFDRIGWHHLKPTDDTQVVGYRIIQHGYLILIGASLFHINPAVSAAFLFSWYMGACDFLYYILGKEYGFLYYTNMYWLWWCPWAYFKIPKTGKMLTLFSLLTVLISFIFLI